LIFKLLPELEPELDYFKNRTQNEALDSIYVRKLEPESKNLKKRQKEKS
jgi:hypothetical protein